MATRRTARSGRWKPNGFLVVLLLSVSWSHASGRASSATAAAPGSVAGLPAGQRHALPSPPDARLLFEANLGQAEDDVLFLGKATGFSVAFTRTGVHLTTPGRGRGDRATVRILTPGQCPHPLLVGVNKVGAKTSYFLGDDPRRWVAGAPMYERVRFEGLYPGIDAEFYGNGRELEFDFVVAPGADLGRVSLRFDGATHLESQPDGSVAIATATQVLYLRLPAAFEVDASGRRAVPVNCRLRSDGTIAFSVRRTNARVPLVVDPVLSFSSFLGGSAANIAYGAASDAAGNLYVVGSTYSSDFPVRGAFQPTLKPGAGANPCPSAPDAFLSKFSPDGTLVYSTYLGGSCVDAAYGVAVDGEGSAYLAGTTLSSDFPTTAGCLMPTKPGQSTTGFVAKVSRDGASLTFSTYLGGGGADQAMAIGVDAGGSAVVVGGTESPDFPVARAFQPTLAGTQDAFIARLDPSGSHLVFGTFLGGRQWDSATAVALDTNGHAYVVGSTASTDFPMSHPLQQRPAGMFVAKVDLQTANLVYSTYFGGTGTTEGVYAVASSADGSAFICGETNSDDFPTTPGAFQRRLASPGRTDAFIAKLLPNGSGLGYASLLGGQSGNQGYNSGPSGPFGGIEVATGIAVDQAGNALVTGLTDSPDFPTADPIQASLAGEADAFVAELNAAGGALVFSTYLGGSDYEFPLPGVVPTAGPKVALGQNGAVWVVGSTDSQDFPVVHPIQPWLGGAPTVFVCLMQAGALPLPTLVATANPTEGQAPLLTSFSAAVTGGQAPYTYDWDFGDGSAHGTVQNLQHVFTLPGRYRVVVTVRDSVSASASNTLFISAAGGCTLACAATIPLGVASGQPAGFAATVTPAGCGGEVTYTWDFGDGFAVTQQNISHTYTSPGVYGWSLTAAMGSTTCTKSGTITVASAPINAAYLIPALAHKSGYFGSKWRSDVAVVNPSLADTTTAHLTLAFRCAGCPSLFAIATVLPGTTAEWSDILASLFGLAEDTKTSGALAIFSDRPVVITARTYNQTALGTMGQSFPALTTSDGLTQGQAGLLAGLKRNVAFRTNIGAINLGDSQCTVLVSLYDNSGGVIGSPQMVTLEAGTWQQLDDVFMTSGAGQQDLGYAKVEVQTPGGRAWTYASVIDNATGDPTTVPVVVLP